MSGKGGIGLTRRERRFHDLKARILTLLGNDPDLSMRELRSEAGCCINALYDALGDLEDDGLIRRLPNRARAIEVVGCGPVMIRGERFQFIPRAA